MIPKTEVWIASLARVSLFLLNPIENAFIRL